MWLGEHGGVSARISAMNSRVPYYARGTLVQFPYASSSVTLRYLDSQKVDYVALESSYTTYMPTIAEWLANGIKDPRVQLVYDTGRAWKERVQIYRLYRDAAGDASVAEGR
jgi:hypothetical protein